MWKLLYQLASPQLFYQRTNRLRWFAAAFSVLFITIGLGWGLCFAPADYLQGNAFRIMYIHVPSAFLSMTLYGFMGFLAILVLVWRIKIAGVLLSVCASIGASFTALALITGSIWGKPMWGTWWIWDARLTSELILLFIYLAILGIQQSFDTHHERDKILSILTLIGLVDLPIIHYSVYWWNTLHQGQSLSLFAKPKIHPSMLYPLLLSCLGFMSYSVFLILSKARQLLLWRERQQRWVGRLLHEGQL